MKISIKQSDKKLYSSEKTYLTFINSTILNCVSVLDFLMHEELIQIPLTQMDFIQLSIPFELEVLQLIDETFKTTITKMTYMMAIVLFLVIINSKKLQTLIISLLMHV